MTATAQQFENYDEGVAQGLQRAHEKEGGLPGFLGIRTPLGWIGPDQLRE